jgi:hypothetical protein
MARIMAEEEASEDVHYEDDASPVQESQQEDYTYVEETPDKESSKHEVLRFSRQGLYKGSFVHGLCVGLGIGCISTFVILWITVFFIPQLPALTYESLLSMFIYPLVYLLAVGLISLTAGIVRQYYVAGRRN